MRRVFAGILCILLLLLTAAPVLASGKVESLQSSTTVSSDGSCRVFLTVQLQLTEVPDRLYFPLPGNARNISLNGSSAPVSNSGSVREVNLRGIIASPGIHTFTIAYALPDAVSSVSGGQLSLNIPLLSGFAYPIQKMDFTVELPGVPEAKPSFASTYYQESTGSYINYRVEGNRLICSFTQSLKDHESLSMQLRVSEDLFPQSIVKKWHIGTDDFLMYSLMFLALVYWLAALRSLPLRRRRRTTPPEGMTAGTLGCALSGLGVDFTMMVVSWAQMGYLLIHLDDNGRVLLHKRMDMGNERSEFEVRAFKSLFSQRRTIDGTGYHYAQLCRKLSASCPVRRSYYRRRSGSTRIFRLLAAGIGAMSGICLAGTFVQDTTWQILLSVLLGITGGIVAWIIQSGSNGLLLRHRSRLILALVASVLWLLLCLWAGEISTALVVLVSQWLAGLAASFGGFRTELGKQTSSEILGFRWYLKTVSKKELLRLLKNNPDYYYTLAPYAMALGIDRSFSARLGKRQLPQCSYLTTGIDGHMTPREWNQLLRDAVTALDERQMRLPYERILGK